MKKLREDDILKDIKALLEAIQEFKGNVNIGDFKPVQNRNMLTLFPIDTDYGEGSANFNVLISIIVGGSDKTARMENVINLKNKVISVLDNASNLGLINNITRISLKKENYVVDTNSKSLYLRGIDLEISIGILT